MGDQRPGPGPGAPARQQEEDAAAAASAATAAATERRRKLQEYLVAKGKLKPASAKLCLKDKRNQQNLAPSKAQLTVRCQKNGIPSTTKSASITEAKWSAPVSKVRPDRPSRALVPQKPTAAPPHLPRKGPTLPVPSKPPAKRHPEKLSSTSAGHHLGPVRESEKWELFATSGTVNGCAKWSRPSKSSQEKAEQDKENFVRQALKRETSRFSLKAKSQFGSKPPSNALEKSQAVEAELQEKRRGPPGDFQRQVGSISGARPSSQLGCFSTIRSRGQNPRFVKQSVETRQAAGVFRGSVAGREQAGQSTHTAVGILQRGQSMQQANALQEPSSRSVTLRRKLRPTSGRCLSAACGGISQNRSAAEKNWSSTKQRQMPRTLESGARLLLSECCTGRTAPGSVRRGRGTPKSKQLAAGGGQEPKTPGTQDRRKLLEQWLASRGKRYKRPPMTLPPTRLPKAKAGPEHSFWDCMEEEEEEEEESQQQQQLRLANRIAGTLRECLQLAEEGGPPAELLAMLSRIPEAEKFPQFWVCKAKLLARQGPVEAAGGPGAGVSGSPWLFGSCPLRQPHKTA
ncbi:cytoskeleton-associated protein 2-like isoform X2 [Rhineura floridana]|uniref:cytoskeleton-associated protein 2-like isoform X2 n=1 Tax=Rhineura floridana TaxID=261503 RepID=UPI002AC81237|nr:cytoskeleton-associated protein 2-like isoform X2 [Rhineura floridana]